MYIYMSLFGKKGYGFFTQLRACFLNWYVILNGTNPRVLAQTCDMVNNYYVTIPQLIYLSPYCRQSCHPHADNFW